ncbi:MAG: FtsH protease activity modulator HflK [Rickettsiales bacterium]|jgi:modulator of FtsH protease HflK|nr:FtsH protease activity modulator HflK [Rickettsiales bacterium]
MLKSLANFTDNPWGDNNSGNGSSGGKSTKGSASNNVLEIEKLLNKYKKNFSGGKGGQTPNSPKSIFSIILIVIALYFSTGFFTIQPEEEGVVLLFGKFSRVTAPGLHYHLPTPFEKLIKVKVTQINSIEIGYRNLGGDRISSRNEESIMLTGDENIVDINFEVQWQIKNAYNFLFKIRDYSAGATVKSAAESVMREVIGKSKIAYVLSDGRANIELEAKTSLQKILDSYESGIEIARLQLLKADPPIEVIDAFRDVQTAKADKEKVINQAEAYRNDILPRARGEAQQLIEEALGYKESVVADATGKADRFEEVYSEYRKAREVTKKRIFLQTMEELLQSSNVTIIDGSLSKTGMVPYLPLTNTQNKK